MSSNEIKAEDLLKEKDFVVIKDAVPPEKIPKHKVCPLGIGPRALQQDYVGNFTLGSVAIDCTDIPELWRHLASAVTTNEIGPILNLSRACKRKTCLHSIYSILLGQFVEPNFAAFVSQCNLVALLQAEYSTIKKISVDRSLVQCSMDNWLDVFCSLQKIALCAASELDLSLEHYNQIVLEICKFPSWVQVLIEDTIDLRCGPLRHITTRVNIANLNVFMDRLKLSTTTLFVTRLFTLPSVAGKCAALYSLLEVHGLIWRSSDYSFVEDLIPTLYNILSWIMEKINRAGTKLSNGLTWISAKFRTGPGENDSKIKDAGKNLPKTKEDMTKEDIEKVKEEITVQCSLQDQVTVYPFEFWFDEFILGKIRTEASIVSYDNNCLFDAIHDLTHPETEATRLRDMALDFFENKQDVVKKCWEDSGVANFESEIARVISNLVNGKMTDDTVLPVLKTLFGKNFAIVHDQRKPTRVMIDLPSIDVNEPVYYIQNSSNSHYFASKRPEQNFVYEDVSGNIIDFKGVKCEAPIERAKVEEIPNEEAEKEGSEEYAKLEEDKKPEPSVSESAATEEETHIMIGSLESTSMGKGFLEWLKTMVKDVFTFFKNNPIVGGITAFGFSVLSALGISIGKFSNPFDKRCFWEKISGCARDFYYLSRGQDAVAKVFGDFGAIIRDMMGIDDNPTVTAFKNQLVLLCDESEQLNLLCTTKPSFIVNNPANLHKFKKDLENVRSQYRDLVRMDPTVNLANLAPLWNRLNASYQQLLNHYGKLVNGNECRPRPACVWFYGPTNVGKSDLATKFVRDINDEQGTAWTSFTVSKGPEYLNGFAQQNVIIIDDFDSFMMQEGCLDALLVMNMITTAAYNPNIANLEDKNLQARPRLLIVCSNFPTVRVNCGINYFPAFERRRDQLICVKWEEHKDCPEGTNDCKHWQDIREKMKATGKKSFDHLSFDEEDPLVLSKDSMAKPLAKNKPCSNPPKRGKDVKIADKPYSQIVKDCVEHLKLYDIAYQCERREMAEQEKKFNERNKVYAESVEPEKTEEDISELTTWIQRPNVILEGPPGTGKTKTLDMLRELLERNQKRVMYVKTSEIYDDGRKCNWNYKNIDYVLFDDFTTWKDLKDTNALFWKCWKERYDAQDKDLAPWILGVNLEVLLETFDSHEEALALLRRSHQFEFKFKKRNDYFLSKLIPGFMAACYTSEDLENEALKEETERRTHSHFVEILDSVSDGGKILQTALIDKLSKWKPENIKVSYQIQLPVVRKLALDAKAIVDIDVTTFINMVNSKGTSAQALASLANAKYQFTDPKFSALNMGKRIASTFFRMTHAHGSQFGSMDDFILTGANSDFFKSFNDGNFVMQFKDRSYCLYTHNGRVHAGIYDPVDVEGDLKKLSSGIVKQIKALDFLAVTHSRLPPWFVVSAQIAEVVLKFLATGASSYINIQTEIEGAKALSLAMQVRENTEKFVESSVNQIGIDHARKLNVESSQVLIAPPISTPVSATEETGVPIPVKDILIEDHGTHPDGSERRNVRPRGQRVRGVKKPKNLRVRTQGVSGFQLRMPTDSTDLVEYLHGCIEESVPEDKNFVEVQLATDDQMLSVVKVVTKNMVDILTLTGEHIVHGLMTHGVLGTTVYHIFEKRTAQSLMVRDCNGTKYTFKVIFTDRNADRVDFELTNAKCSFPDIRKHFFKKTDDPDVFSGKLGCLTSLEHGILVHPVLQMKYYRLRSLGSVNLNTGAKNVPLYHYVGGISGFTTPQPPQTKQGDCGSVMFICDSSNQNKIIGLHVGSSKTEGFFRPLIAEDFCINTRAECASEISGVDDEFIPPMYPFKNGIPVLAKCARKPNMPKKTHYYKSPYAYGTCLYEPSILSPGDPRDTDVDNMITEEAMKWMADVKPLPYERVQKIHARMAAIGDWLGQKLNSYGIRTFVLTKTSALNSVKGFSHSQPIPVGTSAGYPLNGFVSNGKREIIATLEDGSRRFNKDPIVAKKVGYLHRAIDHILQRAKQNELADVAFTIFGKDELLKPGKNTRTIAAAPLSLVIASRMYFHTIYAALAEIWNIIPIKIGISANSLDWHNLAIYLLNVSSKGFAIDQKGFDFRVPKEVVSAVATALDAISQITNPDWDLDLSDMIRGVHQNISYFRVIVEGLVYDSTIGIASGHPGTACENSIISFFFLYDAFCELCPSYFTKSVETFIECVASAVYGDDATCTVSPYCTSWFNQITVTKYLTQTYGLEITNADKSSKIEPYVDFQDLEFISRSFKKMDGYWIGPLNMNRLMKPLNFCHGKKPHDWFNEREKITDDIEIAGAAARSALDEMFFHGQKQYEKLRKHCLKIASEVCDLEVFFPSWNDRYDDFFDLKTGEENDLFVLSIPVDHQIVNLLSKEKGWVKGANRRFMNFGMPYNWGPQSDRLSYKEMPLYLRTVLNNVNYHLSKDFNEILVNVYQPGGEITWHKDNEENVDKEHGIAGLTVIGDGQMEWRDSKGLVINKLPLQPDFMYFMKGKYLDYQHRRVCHTKYTFSLTFRRLLLPN